MADPYRIVVTGATRGIGRSLAEGFAQAGHTVYGCGRDQDAIAELAEQFPAPNHWTALDVTDPAAVEGWVTSVLSEGGAPDFLINNAAVINRRAPLWEVPEEEFAQLFEVNVLAVSRLMRAFLPAMIERGKGIVINLSSGSGRMGIAEMAPYCATKWAIEGLSKSVAQEVPDGLAVIPLSPGTVNTEMLRSIWDEAAKKQPTPEKWAQKAVPYILKLTPEDNGQSLTVQG
ncbi:MAG: short-chain alcohol dehydrogenase [Puniceicoccaceae bacterium 5H]|nr:MAG: short-chain alcohol dehydrogenase [Puniceicoccaceae bacterium 5H]